MTRYDRRVRLVAAGLAALAGFVDATGFLMLGGFFVSFMSGNSTRLGVGLIAGHGVAAVAASLIVAFVVGVTVAALVGRKARRHRRGVMMAIVTAALLAAALLQTASRPAAALALALAMGAENVVFEEQGEVRIALTYMTGTLVKLGQRLADALTGGARWAWLDYAAHWAAMVGGGCAGALAFVRLGGSALWIATASAAVLAVLAARTEARAQASSSISQ